MQMRTILFSVFMCISYAAFADVSGVPRVLSGDTIQIDDVKIKLEGIKAPVPGQLCTDRDRENYDCSEQARNALIHMVGKKPVTCHGDKVFRDGLLRAICYSGGLNLNGAVISAGWAVATGRTADRYRKMQSAAKAKGIGLHAGELVKPSSE